MANWSETDARSYARRRRTTGALAPRDRPEWMDHAACRGRTDLFFPGERGMAEVMAAKRICADCPVRSECLGYALDHDERDGVWGQTSGEDRAKMRRRARMVG
jgi:WhiB family redox-sensing transcriptional regulator